MSGQRAAGCLVDLSPAGEDLYPWCQHAAVAIVSVEVKVLERRRRRDVPDQDHLENPPYAI